MAVATNLSIPGVKTIHQRQAWEDPLKPVGGPAATGVFEDFVGHYPGTGDVPDHDYKGHVYVDPAKFRNDLFGYYRQMQSSYLSSRRYSVGYLFGIDYLGGLTVLRGFDFRNAANAGTKLPGNWNLRSGSAQFVTDLTEPATDLGLYTFAMMVAWLRHNGHRAAIKRHDDGEYTSCPGAVGKQLSAGLGSPEHWKKVGPPPGAAPLPWYLAPVTPQPQPPPPTGVTVTTQSEWQQARVADVTFGPGDQLVRIPQAAGKKAATVNLHVITPNHAGFITAFLGPKPDTSAVNYSPGVVSDGTITVPVDGDGWFALNSSGYVRVLVDLVGVHS